MDTDWASSVYLNTITTGNIFKCYLIGKSAPKTKEITFQYTLSNYLGSIF